MRAFVLMILVLNLAFFGWYYFAGEDSMAPRPKALPQVESGVQSLVLVKEAAMTNKAPVATVEPEAPPPPVLEKKEPPAAAPETMPTLAKVEEKVAAPVSAPKPEPRPVKVAICYKAGPFEKRTAPEALDSMVENYGFEAAITSKKEKQFFGEWIYLTEYGSVQSARDDIVALKEQGIKDVAVTRLDNGELIISLGIYGKKVSLQRRLAELKALGYVNYQTRKRYRSVDQYWLVMSGFEGEKQRILADELGVALKKGGSGANLTIVACK